MDLRALLLKLYFNLESAYYEFLDALDNYVPVYNYLVNPVENRGYPSFPVYGVVFLLIVFILLFSSASTQVQTAGLELSVQDNSGAFVTGAYAEVLAGGETIASGTTEFGRIRFVGIPKNKPLIIKVEKSGFEQKRVSLDAFPTEAVTVSLSPTAETASALEEERRREEFVQQQVEKIRNKVPDEIAAAIGNFTETVDVPEDVES